MPGTCDTHRCPSRIPEIDYDRHPAYGELFDAPAANRRQEAIDKLLPALRGMYDRARKLSKTPLPDFERALDEERLLFDAARPPLGSLADVEPAHGEDPLHYQFRRSGVIGLQLTPTERERMLELTEDNVEECRAKRETVAPELRAVGACSTTVAHTKTSQGCPKYAFFSELLQRKRIFELSETCAGRPLQMKFVMLQMNSIEDRGLERVCSFESGPPSRTFYMHIDSSLHTTKVIIARSRITEKSGPFRYVIGSNRFEMSLMERCIRKACDKSGLDSTERSARELFYALPPYLRRKANFGNDLLDSTPGSEALLLAEKKFTSEDGDLILFDNNGAHRGAIFEEGERQILQILLE